MARNHPGWILEGWGIYKLEAGAENEGDFMGDIEPVAEVRLAFSDALEICEAFNKRKMLPGG
jgi:hypothetical protein